MPELVGEAAVGMGGGNIRGGRGGGRRGGGGAPRGNGGRGGGNGARGPAAEVNGGRRSPQHYERGGHGRRGGAIVGIAGGRKEKLGYHNVDMRKYERMITAAQSNFSDIQPSDPITEDCLICCKPNDIFGVGACRHPLCIECAIRIRVIAKSDGCPVCRQPMEKASDAAMQL